MQIEGPCFIHEARPGRVIFGWGARSAVGEELARLGVERAMIITTPSRADLAAEFARLLLGRVGIVYPGAQPNAPIEVTEAALTAASSVKADGLLAIGGGTAIGLSKAISLRTNLPQVAVPTTFSGCEMAPFLSETERGARVERRSQDVLPRATVYDPELVAHLPPSVAGPSAMNAMANALDALCAPNASPLDAFAATEAMRVISAALPRLLANSADDSGVVRRALWRLARRRRRLVIDGPFEALPDPGRHVRPCPCGGRLRDAALYRGLSARLRAQSYAGGSRGDADRRRAAGALRSDAARRHAQRA